MHAHQPQARTFFFTCRVLMYYVAVCLRFVPSEGLRLEVYIALVYAMDKLQSYIAVLCSFS